MVDALSEAGALAIGYDVSFHQPSDPESDQALGDAAARAGNVVFAASADLEQVEDVPQASSVRFPIPALSEGTLAAHANVLPDLDGVVRDIPPVIETPDGQYLSGLSFVLYQIAEGIGGPPTLRPDAIQVGDRLIPTDDGHLMNVNFVPEKEDEGGIPVLSFVDVVDGNVPADALRDKVVLVGATEPELGDVQDTPIDTGDGQAGVMVHANALNTMLTGRFLEHQGTAATLAWVFGLALLVAIAVAFVPIWVSPILALALAAAFIFFAFSRFDSGTVMNMAYPPIAIVVSFLGALAFRYLTEERERRRVTQVFGRYVASDVVDEVLAAPENALATLEGAERPLSMLFADLRGFTSASEGKQPGEVVEALNVYLDAMTRAVNEELGTIDKFMGDCVMAFWGAPRPTEHHAERAVRAGIRMLDYIDQALEGGKAADFKVKGCGVGIASGPAVVGNIGSADRLDYTVIGDTVNTASRICGVAGAGQVVVTEETKDALGPDFRTAPLPPLVVKGKVEPLAVFQVLREGQEAAEFAEGATLDATEDKGHFEPQQTAPAKAAGYAPIEPVAKPRKAAAKKSSGSSKKKATAARKRTGTRTG
jgi:adenylate cyclase